MCQTVQLETFGRHFTTAPLAGTQGAASMQPDPLGQDSLAIAQRGGLVAHSDLDERAIEALKEFNEDGALAIFQQFNDSDLSHIQNKSAFLCGVMKTYRQREKQGTKVADSSKGPDEAKIKALLGRTGYTLDVTTGQRKYGGPPPDSVYSGQQPSVGIEIFVGKIPSDLFEDVLVPLFEKAGPIWDLRLMMDPLTGLNRGYAFVTIYPDPEVMAKVKVLFVCNLANTVTEEILEKAFSQFGKLERIRKLKDYAFIHFDERDGAVKAMEEMNVKDLEGENIEIVFAKPPDQKRKERKAQRQAAIRCRGRGGRGGYGYPPDYYGYEDYYDYFGYDYHNYHGGYEDPYYGYEDFQVGARGRGGRGVRGAAPSRGHGAAPPCGRAGYSQKGGPGSARGIGGVRGGAQQQRGHGQGKGVEACPDLLQ
uniref:RRM domain-containing protein n=1 Tax=Oryctolagus cuniculus TaxID=9986 RepID=A0A5F9CKC7_RABIT